MKVDISKKLGRGVITLPKTIKASKDTIDIEFPLETLVHWYPLNLNYEYRYSPNKQDMYLTLLDSKAINKSYLIEENKTENKVSNRQKVTCIDWHNDYVYNRNKEIIAFSKELGITNFEDPIWTKESISNGYLIINNCLDSMKQTIGSRFKEYHKKEEVQKYVQSGLEEKEVIMFNYINEDEQELYFKLGEVYTMLNLMMKGV